MKILFSPAKTFKDGIIDTSNFKFKDKTYQIVEQIKKWSKDEFMNNFKISKNLYDETFNYYKLFLENPGYKVYSLYNGQSFISLDFDSLDKQAKEYIFENVVILDALYGMIKFNDTIKKYRLDYNTKNIDPKSIWVNEFNKTLANETILSLASIEFTSLIKSNNLYSVSFVDIVNNKKKKISVFNKQLRGKLLRYLASNSIDSIDSLPEDFEGYQKTVSNKNIVYIR